MTGNKLKQCLIFGGGIKSPDYDQIEEQLNDFDKKLDSMPSEDIGRASAYVQVFENMVRTVLECESDLLSVEEIGILERFSKLCYNARYCLVRLILRIPNRWYPISSLESFKKEVGEDGLEIAIKDLCASFTKPATRENTGVTIKTEPPEVDVIIKQEDTAETIDLSMDLDNEDMKPTFADAFRLTTPLTKGVFDVLWPQRAGTSQLPQAAEPIHSLLASDISTITMDSFCQDESIMTTREILDRINRDQLVALAKEMKCVLRPNSKKYDIIDVLERNAASQQVLDFVTPQNKKAKGKSREDGLRQTQFSFGKPKKNQEQRLRELAIKYLGPCTRLNVEFYRLVRRIHIIYFRETEHPSDVLLPALLSTFKKRNFTPVTHKRTAQVWASRKELLDYEHALELDKLLDDIAEEPKESASKRATKTPTPRRDFTIPLTPGSSRCFSTPLKTPRSNKFNRITQPKSEWDGDIPGFESTDQDEEEAIQITREQRIKKHFDDWVYPGWQEMVSVEDDGVRPRPIGLERFDAGHVYTRMVHKALNAIAKLKDYKSELKVIEDLLDQRFWCRGKRAKWYTRRAVSLGHLVTKEKDPVKKRELQLRILEGIKVALLDDDTGIVHRPNLVKRLQDLEKRLKIPFEERSQCSGELRVAPCINLQAIRVQPQSFDAQGRPINGKENTPELHKYIAITKKDGNTPEDKPLKQTGKSSWQGRDAQVVNVETRALEYYQDQGYKGFHCETRILTMLFGLLFWDIIFAEVLGAFETPYQTAPLDLLYDSFYRARKEMIDERLQEIQEGNARQILERHDNAHRDNAMICVGVSWDLCSREDLLDIVDCIGGQTLSIICQIFCEDYDSRRSGGPDLFVWNVQSQKCKFVEVKGPGDTPQENQKLWFDSLLRANADVEICYVTDIAQGSSKKRRRNTPSSSTRRWRANVPKDDPESEEQDYETLDCDDGVGADELPSLERPKKCPRTEEVKQYFELPTASSIPKLFRTPSKVKVDLTPSKPRTR